MEQNHGTVGNISRTTTEAWGLDSEAGAIEVGKVMNGGHQLSAQGR